jgi:hypothetical protein
VTRRLAAAGFALSLACTAGCGSAGPTKTVTGNVELDDAKAVKVELNMAAGELQVDGGAMRLAESTFTFNVPEWEPQVEYKRDGERGSLVIKQGSSSASFRNSKNSWNVRLHDGLPIALTTSVGAGQGTMRLGSLDLESVQVDAGAGEFTLDLRGTPKRSYDVRVNASVGQTNIRLPKSVAIVATATAGVGGVDVTGCRSRAARGSTPGTNRTP